MEENDEWIKAHLRMAGLPTDIVVWQYWCPNCSTTYSALWSCECGGNGVTPEAAGLI